MSGAALKTIKFQPVRGAGKALLLALALDADDDQCLGSSLPRLMLISGLGRHCVQDHIRGFEAAGWVVRQRRRNRCNLYRLDLPAIASGKAESVLSGKAESVLPLNTDETVHAAGRSPESERADGRVRRFPKTESHCRARASARFTRAPATAKKKRFGKNSELRSRWFFRTRRRP